jgi:Fe-S-cluster-containing dehydrogenase component
MAKIFIHDIEECVGCHSCQVACKDEHSGNDWMPYARPQPVWGQFWNYMEEHVRGTVPRVKVDWVNVRCNHCDDPGCMAACPYDAISKRGDGLVIIDPLKCTGCKLCIEGCPYGNVWFNEDFKVAQKCTGCAHLLDRGWPITEPRCVDACRSTALRFGEESDFSAEISQAEVLHPEYGTSPRVYYLNYPKRFIAGLAYDPGAEEVFIGATCTLSGDSSATTTTDEFGDFWFEGLPVGTFSVTIEAEGKSATIDDISTEMDVNLGDIALT